MFPTNYIGDLPEVIAKIIGFVKPVKSPHDYS
jgi:hypothetical protein